MKRVLILDGTNNFYRAFVVDPSMSTNGKPIGGVKGFLKILQKLVRDIKPDQVVICWDGAGGSQRRRQMNKNYKAGRKAVRLNRNNSMLTQEEEMENRVDQQIRLVEYINHMPIAQFIFDNVEADDLISMANQEYKGWQKVIVSSDKDFFQLLDDETILLRPIQKKIYNKNTLIEEYGIHPTNFALARAIAGDKSDNLPGVPGAGLPTVAKRFPYLCEEKDYTTADLVSTCLHEEKPLKVHDRIIENEKLIKENYKIMQLYNPLVSPQNRDKIKQVISNYPKSFSKTEIRKMMLIDGFPELNWGDLFAFFNKITLTKRP
jgi:5'-3' exonuclease